MLYVDEYTSFYWSSIGKSKGKWICIALFL